MPLLASRDLVGFRYFMRRYEGTYVNGQYTGKTVATPSASTVVLPVHTGPGPSPINASVGVAGSFV